MQEDIISEIRKLNGGGKYCSIGIQGVWDSVITRVSDRAASTGFQPGDKIFAVNGEKVTNLNRVEVFSRFSPGDSPRLVRNAKVTRARCRARADIRDAMNIINKTKRPLRVPLPPRSPSSSVRLIQVAIVSSVTAKASAVCWSDQPRADLSCRMRIRSVGA